MATPHVEVVVLRNGREIKRRVLGTGTTIPERGSVMADQAVINPQRRFAELLSTKAVQAKTLATGVVSTARSYAGKAFNAVIDNGVFAWCKGALSAAYGFLGRQAARLGRVGLIAAAVSVLSSERGRAVVGKAVSLVGKAVDKVVSGVINVTSVLPLIGERVSGFVARARNAVKTTATIAKIVVIQKTETTILRAVRPVISVVRPVATALFVYKALTTFIGGFWAVLAYCTFIALQLLKSERFGSMAANTLGFVMAVRTPKVAAVPVPAAKLASPSAHIAAEIAEDIKLENHINLVKASTPDVTATPEGPVMQENVWLDAPSAAEVTEAQQERAKRTIAVNVIAQVTIAFFGEDRTYSTPGACRAALKGLVLPEFKQVASSKAANQAATAFCMQMVESFGEGDAEFGEPDLNNPSALLVETVMNAAEACLESVRPLATLVS